MVSLRSSISEHQFRSCLSASLLILKKKKSKKKRKPARMNRIWVWSLYWAGSFLQAFGRWKSINWEAAGHRLATEEGVTWEGLWTAPLVSWAPTASFSGRRRRLCLETPNDPRNNLPGNAVVQSSQEKCLLATRLPSVMGLWRGAQLQPAYRCSPAFSVLGVSSLQGSLDILKRKPSPGEKGKQTLKQTM